MNVDGWGVGFFDGVIFWCWCSLVLLWGDMLFYLVVLVLCSYCIFVVVCLVIVGMLIEVSVILLFIDGYWLLVYNGVVDCVVLLVGLVVELVCDSVIFVVIIFVYGLDVLGDIIVKVGVVDLNV